MRKPTGTRRVVIVDKAEIALPRPPAGAPLDPDAHRQRVGWRFIAVYGLAYLGLWMALLPPILVGLAIRVRDMAPEHAADALSLVVGMGALLALFANPFFGRLSDRTASRFGMRRPWLVAGALGSLVGLAIVATAVSVPQLVLGWCITQLACNAQLAALAAILADQVPTSQRGVVSGVVNLSLPLGMVAGTLLVAVLAGSSLAMFVVPAVISLAGALGLAWVLPDHRLAAAVRLPYGWREFFGSFWIPPRRFPDFSWAWGSRFLLYAGVSLLMTYQEFYLIDQLGTAPADVPHRIFLATLVQSCAVALASVACGGLSDALGRRKVFVSVAALAYAVALLMIALVTTFPWFLVGMALAGAAQGAYLTVDLALVTDVLPQRETHAARNLGIFNIASVLPQSLMPAVAPVILWMSAGSYAALFIVAALFSAAGAWAILPVRAVR